ncbi:MAG: hypothetical protein LH624_00980, partial [Cryobacterium sp.]|nr:hypothetical protein [Cryobacterium sp.]
CAPSAGRRIGAVPDHEPSVAERRASPLPVHVTLPTFGGSLGLSLINDVLHAPIAFLSFANYDNSQHAAESPHLAAKANSHSFPSHRHPYALAAPRDQPPALLPSMGRPCE